MLILGISHIARIALSQIIHTVFSSVWFCFVNSSQVLPTLKIVIVDNYEEKSCKESGESTAEDNLAVQVEPQLGEDGVEEEDGEQAEDADRGETWEDVSRVFLAASPLSPADFRVDSLVIHPTQVTAVTSSASSGPPDTEPSLSNVGGSW